MRKSGQRIRVMVVDDNLSTREMLSTILSSDPDLVVVGEARDGVEAVAKAMALKPDIVTMDIEMPVMNGLEAIERIIGLYPVPILAVTALSGVRAAFNAVSKGALDVLEKTDIGLDEGAKLIRKIKLLADVDVAACQISICNQIQKSPAKPSDTFATGKSGVLPVRMVAIAASTGGPQALNVILSGLPPDFPAPIVIAQHVASGFTEGMADWLNSCTGLTVLPACHGETVRPGRVYLNPAEFSMRISRRGVISLSEDSQNQLYHPSCDTLLDSVATAFGANAVAIILSGMGSDGVSGMGAVRSAGGLTIAQDEKSSVIFGMNGLAIKQGYVQNVLSLAEITSSIMKLAGVGDGGHS